MGVPRALGAARALRQAADSWAREGAELRARLLSAGRGRSSELISLAVIGRGKRRGLRAGAVSELSVVSALPGAWSPACRSSERLAGEGRDGHHMASFLGSGRP